MLESELFGYEKGAFTGAYARKPGLLEIANNGALFLDEIGELPMQLQVKFLRVLETETFFRVGGTTEIKVNVKFVSATNKDLKAAVENRTFRADLYYRISALTLHIPPLRERREDIPLLIEYFTKNNPSFRNKQFSKEAIKILSEYSWPGNIRELQNILHRILLLSKTDTIEQMDLPQDLASGEQIYGKRLEDIEREHIIKVLRETGKQKANAAKILGIDPKTLYRKLLLYGIKRMTIARKLTAWIILSLLVAAGGALYFHYRVMIDGETEQFESLGNTVRPVLEAGLYQIYADQRYPYS